MARSTSPHGIAATPTAPIVGARRRPVALNLLISLRPGQWSKNLLVFAGLLFGNAPAGRGLLDLTALGHASLAFGIFCALSGAVYVINDVLDRESDRQHPLKARRPIASGELPAATALVAAAILGVAAIAAAFALGWQFASVAIGYVSL